MRVRPMTLEDAGTAAGLSGQLGYPATPAQIRERLAALQGDPGSAIFVAEDEAGRVVGWVHVIGRCFLETGRFAELAGLVVDAAARRGGAGRSLVAAAEAWAAGRGYAAMRVRSNMKRAEARPFYERLGYVVGKQQYVFLKNLS